MLTTGKESPTQISVLKLSESNIANCTAMTKKAYYINENIQTFTFSFSVLTYLLLYNLGINYILMYLMHYLYFN